MTYTGIDFWICWQISTGQEFSKNLPYIMGNSSSFGFAIHKLPSKEDKN